MNWDNIFKKYPKSLLNFLKFNGVLTDVDDSEINEYLDNVPNGEWVLSCYFRELYDFFDDNYIILETWGGPSCWSYVIDGEHGRIESMNIHLNRKEAEFVAFEKCFEMLEKG